jgi:hypothetical protein
MDRAVRHRCTGGRDAGGGGLVGGGDGRGGGVGVGNGGVGGLCFHIGGQEGSGDGDGIMKGGGDNISSGGFLLGGGRDGGGGLCGGYSGPTISMLSISIFVWLLASLAPVPLYILFADYNVWMSSKRIFQSCFQ